MNELIQAIKKHAPLTDEDIRCAAEHGADSGLTGFTYNDECGLFFDDHSEMIWELLAEDAEDQGYANPMALIATFKRADMSDTVTGFKALIAWYALEKAGQWLISFEDEGDDAADDSNFDDSFLSSFAE